MVVMQRRSEGFGFILRGAKSAYIALYLSMPRALSNDDDDDDDDDNDDERNSREKSISDALVFILFDRLVHSVCNSFDSIVRQLARNTISPRPLAS